MLRAITFALFSLLAVPVLAGPSVVLSGPAETASLAVGETHVVAFYARDTDKLQLTAVFTDADGSVLRTRVQLDKGQRHSILLGRDDHPRGTRFDFRRVGDVVELRVTEPGTDLAAQGQVLSNVR